ncbi:NADH dehydrogenase [Sporomusa rhizae]|uniref:nitroreductase family protein n=1 Tax=Sporomusa rhizae TaxID=357999 RepID=UPI00352AD8DC
MKFLDLVQKRKSVRQYKEQMVEDDALRVILEAGRLAPSAANAQPWYFIVVKDAGQKEKIAEAYSPFNLTHYKSAPVFIVICGDHQKSWHRSDDGKDHCDVDIAIAVDHMTLAAADLGLGTCWVCGFDPKKLSEALHLPQHVEPTAVLHVGYPATELTQGAPKNRRPLEEVVFWDGFQNNL